MADVDTKGHKEGRTPQPYFSYPKDGEVLANNFVLKRVQQP